MLWYKGWLETRFKLCLVLVFMSLLMILVHSASGKAGIAAALSFSVPAYMVMICALLAGAGIATQPGISATKGLHGSTLFTLALPVSRLRLLAIRSGIGWLEGAGVMALVCAGIWVLSPVVRSSASAGEMLEYWMALVACTSALYFISVLLATFLDDQWRVWGTMIVSMGFLWASTHFHLPAFVDLFRGMGEGSPLLVHAEPWGAMAFALAISAVLFFAAFKIVQRREY
jgi:hypothetical protein